MSRATLPETLRARVAALAGVAAREKRRGIWETFTWADVLGEVQHLAEILSSHGFRRGDRLVVIGENRLPLYWIQLAAQALGGATVPLDVQTPVSFVRDVLRHCGARYVAAEDQEQVDKTLEATRDHMCLAAVFYVNPRGLKDYDPAMYVPLLERSSGKRRRSVGSSFPQGEIGRSDDVAVIVYPPGARDATEPIDLSHEALIAAARGFGGADTIGPNDELMAFQPLGSAEDVVFSLVMPVVSGAAMNCPECPQTRRRDLREIGPTALFAPRPFWEALIAEVLEQSRRADRLQRRAIRFFLGDGRDARRSWAADKPLAAIRYRLGRWLILDPMRDQLGLRRVRVALTSEALDPDGASFLRTLGLAVRAANIGFGPHASLSSATGGRRSEMYLAGARSVALEQEA